MASWRKRLGETRSLWIVRLTMSEDKLQFEPKPPEDIWYYSQGKHMYGPVSFIEMQRLTMNGNVLSEDYVWRAGFDKWVLAEEIPNLFPKSHFVGVN